jgi:KUP system potassium uptake protein
MMIRNKPTLDKLNPFYELMPGWFLVFGIIIATAATIIASQALITGSFTLISEAVSLHFWPRVTIKFPTNIKGQIYIPSVNWILWFGCIGVMLYFKESSNMEAAYGFSITIAMLMTTLLMFYYLLLVKKMNYWLVVLILIVFLTVEGSFFIANIAKIKQRWMFLIFEFGIIFTMYVWYHARRITNRFLDFVSLKEQLPTIMDLSNDTTIAKYATHLIYLTKANYPFEIEQRVIYSIFSRNPKRADKYWFVHIDRTDQPYTMEYSVEELAGDKVIRVNFRLGFRVQPRLNMLFRKVVQEMVAKNELDITSKYESLNKYNLAADFKFVILERFLSIENEFSVKDGFILNTYFAIKGMAQHDTKAFGLDTSDVVIEKIPLVVSPITKLDLKRVPYRKRNLES